MRDGFGDGLSKGLGVNVVTTFSFVRIEVSISKYFLYNFTEILVKLEVQKKIRTTNSSNTKTDE